MTAFPPGSPEDVADRKRRLWRAMVSVSDFGEARTNWSLQAAVRIETSTRDAAEGLTLMVQRTMRAYAIVAYARPFLGSFSPPGSPSKQDRLTLEQLTGSDGSDAWWLDLHGRLLALRAQFLAHADSSETARDPVVQVLLTADRREIDMEFWDWWAPVMALDYNKVNHLILQMHSSAEALAFDLADQLLQEGHLDQRAFDKGVTVGGSRGRLRLVREKARYSP